MNIVEKIDLKRYDGLNFLRIWLPIVLLIGFLQPVFASPLPSGQSVTISSEFQMPGHPKSSGPKKWIVRGVAGEGSISEAWEVFPAGSDAPFCRIEISAGGTSGTIIMTDLNNGRQHASDNGLLILPGYPAPCNVLPVYQQEPEKFYDEKRSAGGRVFVRRYRVLQDSIPRAVALSEGWVKTTVPSKAFEVGEKAADDASPQAPLRMLTVMDDTETPVVRQLWREGDIWWIYEETPFKRSWRVE